MKQEVLLCC